jgi:tetratricopeptide (TPR) repeat protein
MQSRNAQLQADEGSVKLAGIRQLTERRCHGDALVAIAALEPELAVSRDALYLTAVNQRSLNQGAAALATLERLQRLHPHFSRLYEERGHCLAAVNDVPSAIHAFECGVNINAALPSSWSMLERLYRITGDVKKATIAAGHLAMLGRLPPQIVQAGSLFSDGEPDSAERIIREFLRASGTHVEALRLLGRIAHQRSALDDAERLFEEVLRLAPTYRAARADYVRVLIVRQNHLQARAEIAGLLKLEPDNRDYRSLQATVCAGLGEHEGAITLYRELVAAEPNWPHLRLLLGNSLKAVGRQRDAIESYRAAAVARPSFGDAYWSMANLKTYRFTADEIERMRAEEAAPATLLVDRYHLCFSLGKAFEDRGEYAESWRYYERGNALKRAQSRYDPLFTEINTREQIEVCTTEIFAAHAGAGLPDPAPIFIVGLPRSGSTLIEQILASHSQVEGTQELHDIERIVRELQGPQHDANNPRYPAVLATLGREDFSRLGGKYISGARAYRKGKPGMGQREIGRPGMGKPEMGQHEIGQLKAGQPGMGQPFFIDKMPNNFRHIGLIHLLLPRAKIIDVRREPMACCFSNLKQLFASGQEFTYSIESIARYYRSYLELMRHWDRVLPGRVLHLSYEDVVEDVEASVRRVMRFCELEFEPGCVEFYKTARSVSTASSEQVRQPIFRTGLSQWCHYETWLGPLKEALGDALVRYRD